MTLFSKLRDALLRRPAKRAGSPVVAKPLTPRVDELPPFSLQTAELMRFDPQVRIALAARNGLLMSAQVEISGPQTALNRWVQLQWDRLWMQYAHQLLKAKLYGFMPFEVIYGEALAGEFRGLIEVAALKDRHPRDCRLLIQNDEPVGFVLRQQDKEVENLAPLALTATFDAETANPYGCALLARAYPSWYEKWMEGGAKRTIRLRMIKDAYLGEIFWHVTYLIATRLIRACFPYAVQWRRTKQQPRKRAFPMSPAALDQLRKLRAELDSIQPESYPYTALVGWMHKVTPLIKQHFPTFFDEWKPIAKKPEASLAAMAASYDNPDDNSWEANRRNASGKTSSTRKASQLASFLDGIIAAASIETVGASVQDIKKPDGSSVHFGTVYNSAIMMHRSGSTQNLTFTQANKNNAASLVAAMREAIRQMELSDPTKEALLSDLDYADNQLKRESPKPGIIKATLEGVHDGLIEVTKSGANVATVAVATGLAERVWQYLTGGSS